MCIRDSSVTTMLPRGYPVDRGQLLSRCSLLDTQPALTAPVPGTPTQLSPHPSPSCQSRMR
eukprot:8051681-Karenia_brevis.AAC.1